ncbi:MAG: helical backbone metal receptor [Myxococcota bacterium]|jgi:iron complex transport system substrate-binding protein|nr:hypothetical protein [Deltaproteobacteria bacterium]MDP6076338.1 helical backbone metal receptor [Myxococcota bacterium]MDP6243439.1 helical backbone metal receptor [Myxococcota bacterium]MDP7074138.1 helical backbone metal receptor [Myxococcota bacterium]MDP7299300.1 helical backbone metal receptor [Myxococcota bacterium]
MRAGRIGLLLLALALLAAAAAGVPRRVVSLNPSLTATVLALGAGGLLVGVDDWSARQQPAVRGRPTVGGLFTPSLEAVVALEPDLVVLVPSAQQRALRDRLRALGIEVLELPNITLDDLLVSIERLGERLGRGEAAARRVEEIRRAFERAAAASGQSRPRALLVIQREPLYVVGAGSFLDAMLRAAGARNAAAEFPDPYPRVDLEWAIAAQPEVILDATEGGERAERFWARWPSLPAVARGRVVAVPGDRVILPGPNVDTGLSILRAALNPGGESP